MNNDLVNFLLKCADSILELAEDAVSEEAAIELKAKLQKTKYKEFNTQHYPAIDLLDGISKTPYTFNFDQIATQLKWRSSPRTDFDVECIAISTINEMLNLDGLLAGLMFMSPNQIYPEHQHKPQELYFILSGSALWFHGGKKGYHWRKPGDILYNHPNDKHGIKTEEQSLLALYLLWGNKVENYSY